MRINKFVAAATGMSRRSADKVIAEGRVVMNGQPVDIGSSVGDKDIVIFDSRRLELPKTQTILINKPLGFVCSRNGQGSKTIYELLPQQYHELKPVGRLDKDSSGLLVLTNDGDLANTLTHPRFQKNKIYDATINQPLSEQHEKLISQPGVQLEDGISRLQLLQLDNKRLSWQITIQEGRNRQIRRTFARLGYTVHSLHRITFGPYSLEGLPSGAYRML